MIRSYLSILGIVFVLATASFARPGDAGEKANQPPTKSTPGLAGLTEKILGDAQAAENAAAVLEAAYQGKPQPENVRMLLCILRGSRMGPGEGWFGPSQTRYTWSWLAAAHGIDPTTKEISRKAFRGTDAEFASLDRDRDGVLSATDLDWSEGSPIAKAGQQAKALFDSIDDGDGKVNPEEWLKLMKKLGGERDFLTRDDLIPLFLPKNPARPASKAKAVGKEAKMPPALKQMILKGFFDGDIGSWCEGPQLGEPAPDFTLPTPDGKKPITLSHSFGKKPVVLIFGSFT